MSMFPFTDSEMYCYSQTYVTFKFTNIPFFIIIVNTTQIDYF